MAVDSILLVRHLAQGIVPTNQDLSLPVAALCATLWAPSLGLASKYPPAEEDLMARPELVLVLLLASTGFSHSSGLASGLLDLGKTCRWRLDVAETKPLEGLLYVNSLLPVRSAFSVPVVSLYLLGNLVGLS